jgi:hypothetical protein
VIRTAGPPREKGTVSLEITLIASGPFSSPRIKREGPRVRILFPPPEGPSLQVNFAAARGKGRFRSESSAALRHEGLGLQAPGDWFREMPGGTLAG